MAAGAAAFGAVPVIYMYLFRLEPKTCGADGVVLTDSGYNANNTNNTIGVYCGVVTGSSPRGTEHAARCGSALG